MTWSQKAKFLFAAFMIIIFFGLAILFAFTDFYNNLLFSTRRIIFAGVLVLYGSFRAYMLYLSYKRVKNNVNVEG